MAQQQHGAVGKIVDSVVHGKVQEVKQAVHDVQQQLLHGGQMLDKASLYLGKVSVRTQCVCQCVCVTVCVCVHNVHVYVRERGAIEAFCAEQQVLLAAAGG